MITSKFKINGLHCPACKKLTEKRISNIAGVTSVYVDQNTGLASITASKSIERSEITKALAGTEYTL